MEPERGSFLLRLRNKPLAGGAEVLRLHNPQSPARYFFVRLARQIFFGRQLAVRAGGSTAAGFRTSHLCG